MATHRFEIDEIASEFGIARELLREGAAPSDRIEFLRGGKLCLSGSVGWFANRRVEETATVSPRFAKWRPFPDVRRRQGMASDASGAITLPAMTHAAPDDERGGLQAV
jgi:hypothetical protein